MPENDFQTARQKLVEARREIDAARAELFRTRNRLKHVKSERRRLDRVFHADRDEDVARRAQLNALEQERSDRVRELEDLLADGRRKVGRVYAEFLPFTDPREAISKFGDSYPLLMMPVRIETRFKHFEEREAARYELWVRVFPDDIAVDTFEQVLSESELVSARAYWVDLWRSGRVEADDRAAWRGLVGSFGSGRAAWILETYRPLKPDLLPVSLDDRPQKADPDDVILVTATERLLPADQQQAADTYWKAYWLADGNPVAEADADAALRLAVTNEEADLIQTSYRPENPDQDPGHDLGRGDVTVQIATLLFPDSDDIETKAESWTQPGRVNLMPDRFVLQGYVGEEQVLNRVGSAIPSPLDVSLDPGAPAGEQLNEMDGDLVFGEDIEWMVNFDRAVQIGMGFKVPLTRQQFRRGFDRLLVIGVRLASDATESADLLEDLLTHHRDSRKGFELLKKGTPTNNTLESESSYSWAEDPDESYYLLTGRPINFGETDWRLKKDGQWLAESLGIGSDFLKTVHNADGLDQSEARALNTALWPSTLGYFMDSMMSPVFDDETIAKTRWYFSNFVSGRGMIPTVRVGKQPYGILPATAISRMSWFRGQMQSFEGLDHPDQHLDFLAKLHGQISIAESDWKELAQDVAFVGKDGDPHQILLDILGLHSGSVSYYQRFAETLDHILNRLKLTGSIAAFTEALQALRWIRGGTDLLAKYGYDQKIRPELLEKLFFDDANRLNGPVVDDVPLSETEPIRPYTPVPDNHNYIDWLIKAATTSLDKLRSQTGFTDNRRPTALLYIMLRHALLQGYYAAGLHLYHSAGVLTASQVQEARVEPSFIHVAADQQQSASRWQYLYRPEERITQDSQLFVADYVRSLLGRPNEAIRELDEQIAALRQLADTPTARLERLFAEHVDCVSYRLDAWRQGLTNYQLAHMRYRDSSAQPTAGLYLGMYGYLVNVKPEHRNLTRPELSEQLATQFGIDDDHPVMRDSNNAGYVHAPSLNHAVTAAVLRNGYISDASADNPDNLAINLSSERVRRALTILEGIRNGQSLGALLGYEFERGLHERYTLAEVDKFILDIRLAFPLVTNNIKDTAEPNPESIEVLEARNVVDGLKLVEHVQATGNSHYPFGKSLPDASEEEKRAIDEQVQHLLDSHDAVADLALAEGVHQQVQGNYDRAASTINAFSKASFPTDPDVVKTPRSGIPLTHRLALHLEADVDPTTSQLPGRDPTPRANGEPAINKWLAAVLPAADRIVCQVKYKRATDGLDRQVWISADDLNLQPIDLLYMINPERDQALTDLDDRILHHVITSDNVEVISGVEIQYAATAEGTVSLFELSAQIQSLRALLLKSRPLRVGDLTLPQEATSNADRSAQVDPQRVTLVKNKLETLKNQLQTLLNTLRALDVEGSIADKVTVFNNIDTYIVNTNTLMLSTTMFGLPQTGIGAHYNWRASMYQRYFNLAAALTGRWQPILDRCDSILAEFAALPPDATDTEKISHLQRAEILISTEATVDPNDPAVYLATVNTKRDAFAARLSDFANLSATTATTLSQLRTEFHALLPIDSFDTTTPDTAATDDEILRFFSQLRDRIGQVVDDLGDRLKDVTTFTADAYATSDPGERMEKLVEALGRMLGEEFKVIPHFTLAEEQADEWTNSVADSANLLRYQTVDLRKDFPVDDWLCGLARVRDKIHHWENLTFLTQVLTSRELSLLPVQFPYRPGDYWLGLEFPDDYWQDPEAQGQTERIEERLLYTAHFARPFDRSKPQAGLLLDEWPETIPTAEESTGLTFHYDRPNSEPPQAMLLVTPSDFRGNWRWADVVDAINETFDMARQRAVEPDMVNGLAYACLLPATLMMVTRLAVTIEANLALNNNFTLEAQTNNE